MSNHKMSERNLDARPDRMDFRDLGYRPPLISLPDQFPSDDEVRLFLDAYLAHGSIRDQGEEGSCTGFGLAACIDYIGWDRSVRQAREQAQAVSGTDSDAAKALATQSRAAVPRVSPFMLYDIAKMYDEWEGEDYSGSSCRGALKGWHKHGVCTEAFWRARTPATDDPTPDKIGPQDGWREDAAKRPLGAYYRVNARSISDLQAAIHEVRAVFCSARVHDGWKAKHLALPEEATIGDIKVPQITKYDKITGGHAFAMVGYTSTGFIIQNSWGPDWGHGGFALLTYGDWIENGNDAWVAALGAPISVSNGAIPYNRTSTPLALTATMRATRTQTAQDAAATDDAPKTAPDTTPWTSDAAYDHAVVLGNEGLPLRRRIDMENAQANVQLVAHDKPLAAARADGGIKIMLYAHGGLNSEKAAIERAMRMGPWMRANGIYPIFIVWRTSLLETLANIQADFVTQFQEQRDDLRAEGLGTILHSAIAKLQNAFDKAFEVTAETTIGKPIWSQMKQNARAAANGTGGTRQVFVALQQLRETLTAEGLPMEVHIAGHSAGAILLGHMLDDFSPDMPVETATLLAPACTMDFAINHYGRAFKRNVLAESSLRIHVLSDENERDDRVGPYGKSLLYLVSRALDTPRKQPLLGLAQCLDAGNETLAAIATGKGQAALNTMKDELGAEFAMDKIVDIRNWRELARKYKIDTRVTYEAEFITKVRDVPGTGSTPVSEQVKIPADHGSFDNSLSIMNDTVHRILGEPEKHPITDLSGF